MDKISGIVPSSARVTSVDLQNSASATRPGSPSFGRPMGTSALGEGKAAEQIASDPNSHIVKDMADKFFSSRLNPIEDDPIISNDQLMPKGSFVNVQA